jgi:hypothetical protein
MFNSLAAGTLFFTAQVCLVVPLRTADRPHELSSMHGYEFHTAV